MIQRLLNISTLQSTCHETFHSFYCNLTALPRLRAYICYCFRANRHMGAEPERATRKIRYAAGLYLPAGDVAPNDLAVWRVHKLPGERRCEWQQHRRRRCERAV